MKIIAELLCQKKLIGKDILNRIVSKREKVITLNRNEATQIFKEKKLLKTERKSLFIKLKSSKYYNL